MIYGRLGDRDLNQNMAEEILDRRPSYVKRWHVHPARQVENLAEHQWYVAYYTWIIGTTMNRQGCPVDMAKALGYALFHDLPEVVTGDIPASFKGVSPEAAAAIKEWERGVAQYILNGMEDLRDEALGNVFAEEHEVEKRVEKVADRLSAWSFAEDEVRTGNGHFEVICASIAGSIMRASATEPILGMMFAAYPELKDRIVKAADKADG